MVIIYRGYGFLVLIVVIAAHMICRAVVPHALDLDNPSVPMWAYSFGWFVAALSTWFLGRALNDASSSWEQRHSLYFLPVEFWSFVCLGFGVLSLLSLIH